VKRIDRSLALFSLSALDALACATGVFVLLIVVLMPYYRNSFDAQAAIEGLRMATSETAAELQDIQAQLDEETNKAAAALAEAQRIMAQAAGLKKPTPVPPTRVPAPEPKGQPVAAELDLVFVVDTTASMGPVLREMARSMASIVRILERLAPSVRIGVVAYRDYDSEPPLLMTLPLTSTQLELERILGFVAGLRASRMGSYPIQEEVRVGLYTAMAMPLRPSARQAIVLVGDAAAHIPVQGETLERTRRFVAESERRTVSALFVTTPSSLSIGNADRAYFVQLALAGRGVFTDHIGSMIESILLSILAE
jgi:Mg-chelatase subunit ChlD